MGHAFGLRPNFIQTHICERTGQCVMRNLQVLVCTRGSIADPPCPDTWIRSCMKHADETAATRPASVKPRTKATFHTWKCKLPSLHWSRVWAVSLRGTALTLCTHVYIRMYMQTCCFFLLGSVGGTQPLCSYACRTTEFALKRTYCMYIPIFSIHTST